MTFSNPRTEVGMKLYEAACKARKGKFYQRDADQLSQICIDILPDDRMLIEALEVFLIEVFRDSRAAADTMFDWVVKWWKLHFPNDHRAVSQQPFDWQLRKDTGG